MKEIKLTWLCQGGFLMEAEGLRIESGPEGTTVSFRVPRRTREDIENDQGLSGG